jgi:hypothetical protein
MRGLRCPEARQSMDVSTVGLSVRCSGLYVPNVALYTWQAYRATSGNASGFLIDATGVTDRSNGATRDRI